MRVVVAAAVEVAILAVVAQGGVSGSAAILPLTLAPVGYVFSYRQRHRSNITTKVLLSVGLLAAFAAFLQSVQLAGLGRPGARPARVAVPVGPGAPRVRRAAAPRPGVLDGLERDPHGGGGRAVAVVVVRPVPGPVGGARGRLAVPFEPAALRRDHGAGHRSGGARPRTSARERRSAAPPGRGSVAVLASALVFMGIPRLPGTLVRSLPFSLGGAASTVANFAGGVENPSLPAESGDGVVDFAPNAYPGFSDMVDLRARGHLSDEVAFRVRTPQAALWRAEAFDTFDGTIWTISDRDTDALLSGDAANSAILPPGLTGVIGPVPTVRITQTFYIDTQQPNVLFAAAVPSEVYFPAGGLKVDRYGSIRSPILLDEGMVYSVVSDVPVMEPRILRWAHPAEPIVGDPSLPAAAGGPPRARGRAGSPDHRRRTDAVRPCGGGPIVDPREHEVRPRRAEGPRRRRRGRSLPVRDADRVLRADRDVARGHAPDARDPDAPGDGLRPGRAQPVDRLLRGEAVGRARVGRGVLPGHRVGPRTTRRSVCPRRPRTGAAGSSAARSWPRWVGSCRASSRTRSSS